MARLPNTEAREKILEAAHDLFYTNGFKGVSMDDVAVSAGIKKANLFHYYPTKERLCLAVFEWATRGFQERWAARLRADQDPIALIGDLFDNTRRGMQKQGCCGGCFIGNIAQEVSDSSEAVRQEVAAHLKAWHRQLTTYFSRHQAAGYFHRDFNASAAAQAVLCLFEGALLFAKATRDAQALGHAKRMAISFLEGERGESPRGGKIAKTVKQEARHGT
jgi:TetR/AcrR family transcriptional regulator, transcriptional repressor for nem operon